MAALAELFDQALRLHQAGDLAQAEPLYRQVLAADTIHADAKHLLGVLAHQIGHHDEAIALIAQAIALEPQVAEYHFNLGTIRANLGHLLKAIGCFKQALKLNPAYADALVNLGSALRDLGQIKGAVEAFHQAAQVKPNNASIHSNLGVALKDLGNLPGALDCYRRALECDPNFTTAYTNLGLALHEQGQLEEAIDCYQNALKLAPNDPTVLIHLVHQLQHLCIWQNLNGMAQQVIDAVANDTAPSAALAMSPYTFLTLPIPTTAPQQFRCARQKAALYPTPRLELPKRRPGKTKITLGYLSCDFRKHAVAYLLAEMFELHDRDRFEVVGYSYGPDDGSPFRKRLVAGFDRFVEIQDASFMDAAQRIVADEVDILIDLNGYTGKHRTHILALRPAPVQVSYLGYPSTMGASFIDYILVDDFIVPPRQQPFYTERLVYLPGCYQVNDSQRQIAARTPSRTECGLPADGFVFCAFNNSFKITPEMFDVWMGVLKEVPGSVLWLLEGNRCVPGNLCREARARGVPAERLIFAPSQPLEKHLARLRLADLFLDTFPYGAHTTASDALWAGCPILTLLADTFTGRVAASVLRTIGLPELVTNSLAEYKAMAPRLAHDAPLLNNIKKRLLANRATSRLFNSRLFTQNLEKAYATMVEIHLAGEQPRGFAVNG